MTIVRAHRLLSVEFLAAYVTTMRPYLLFVSGITGIVGMSLVPGVETPRTVIIVVATFLSYGFGQALTDCFQIDTDSISSPYRPLTQGAVTRGQVMAVSLVGLGLCVTALGLLNTWNFLLGALAGVGLATYTPFKRRWWGGPWYNAWIVGVLSLMGLLAATGLRSLPMPRALPWTLCAVFFGYANFVLAGYFKDIAADARSNYDTFPVHFGRAKAAVGSSALALLAIVSTIAARSAALPEGPSTIGGALSWGFLAAAMGVSAVAQHLLHRVQQDEQSHTAIGLVVHAYLLGLSAIASAAQPGWGAFLLLFYIAFVVVLRARPSRSQI